MPEKPYDHRQIELKWHARWENADFYKADEDSARPKFYVLEMLPYPSGTLHIGHIRNYSIGDALARYKWMRGYNVLHPMGWDAFGLPAEQYAIRTGQHPRKTTEANIAVFKRQIKALGFSYDWSREIDTTAPGYFKWTQWIFLKLYNSWFNPATGKAEPIETLPCPPECAGSPDALRQHRDGKRLAYVTEAPVWWCEELGTVLANEEVVEGRSEVGGFPVTRRPMRQWMLRITAYAERLLRGLEQIDWSDSLKEMQRNWIGRSDGAEVQFRLADAPSDIPEADRAILVFTTRPDTLFGATYMVLSPEHKLVDLITTPEQRAAVADYKAEVARKSDLERTELARQKTGVFTGAHAVNPVNNEKIPIWIADYVLASYGTGAIMAVPGHDTRDLEFARKFNLPVRLVVQAPGGADSTGFVGDGVSVNSGFLSGLPTPEAKTKINAWLEEKGLGRATVNFKLRDWLFSRQRYWGEPFPILWKPAPGGAFRHEAIPESALPLQPPDLTDFKPAATGEPPLARAKDWVCLPDGSRRETNTMPQWAGSCWYYLRFTDARNDAQFCGAGPERYWMGTAPGQAAGKPGVDLYVGGIEHAVLHLLYSRFWHNVLFDLGYVSTPEPFFKLVNQGLILGEDGQKMSKSRGNVINPDDILREYGADALRLYEMFMGPLEMVKPWSTKGVEGVYRFLGRVWRLFVDEKSETEFEQHQTAHGQDDPESLARVELSRAIRDVPPTPTQLKTLHACIKKVTEDLDGFRFNTAISALMVFVNDAITWETKPAAVMREFLVLLHPFAPHLAEELRSKMAGPNAAATIAYEPWPAFDPAVLAEDTIEMPVQVNGKLRDKIIVPIGAPEADIRAAALASEKARQFMEGKPVKKVIIVPRRLVNIVV